jgi:hypothetical protein
MVASNSTASPDSYRVDTVRGEQGNIFQVVRCELVARFDNEEHAVFLVELLKGGAHG